MSRSKKVQKKKRAKDLERWFKARQARRQFDWTCILMSDLTIVVYKKAMPLKYIKLDFHVVV